METNRCVTEGKKIVLKMLPTFSQVKVPFENLVRAMDYLLTLKLVPMFRRFRDSIEILEIHGPQLNASGVDDRSSVGYQQRQPPHRFSIF